MSVCSAVVVANVLDSIKKWRGARHVGQEECPSSRGLFATHRRIHGRAVAIRRIEHRALRSFDSIDVEIVIVSSNNLDRHFISMDNVLGIETHLIPQRL
jgi:hypothetical protein